jgi:hypothetical protein
VRSSACAWAALEQLDICVPGALPDPPGGHSLDDLLYWFCESVVTRQAAKRVGAERFKYEYQLLSQFDTGCAKRRVRELAALFRNGQPEDISLLPDIGETL